MSNVDFENDQDMPVGDKLRPSLGPTEGSQDVDSRPRNIVPMPQFTDPHNPLMASNSVNLSLNDAPVPHAESYGGAAKASVGDHPVENAMSEGSRELQTLAPAGTGGAPVAPRGGQEEAPADRAEWKKAHWVNAAKGYDLPVSGNMDEVKGRVEQYEKELDAAKSLQAGDWTSQIEEAKDAESLASLRGLYDRSGADYSTVVEAFDAKKAEFDGDNN